MNPFQSNPIVFPDLGITLNPPQTAFTVFGIGVQWYGIIITIGFLLAILYGLKRAPEFGVGRDPLIDILLFSVPAALIGARAYYVLFNFSYYKEDPIRIFYFREGGLAIYGAIILSLFVAVLVSRFKSIRPGAVMDLGALGFLIGQAVGRWGNFINREAFGSQTTLPWRMRLTYGGMLPVSIDVHPCFLYESLWNLLGFLILHLYSPKRRYDGELFLLYVAWYGAGRGAIEILRADSLYIPGTEIPVSLMLGFLSSAVAIAILIYNRQRLHDPEKMQAAIYETALLAAEEVPADGDSTEDKGADSLDFAEGATEAEIEIGGDVPGDKSARDVPDAELSAPSAAAGPPLSESAASESAETRETPSEPERETGEGENE